MNRSSKIYIAGHLGLVGSAIVRRLNEEGYHNLLLRSRAELDLTRQAGVEAFFRQEHPEYCFLAAAKVGGIGANSTLPADFIYQNLAIQTNIIHSAYLFGVKKMLFLGSSCIYPKLAPQPLREEYLLDGRLEPTNEPYAIAKIAGIKMCQAYNRQYGTSFMCVMPTNLYGPNDNYDLATSHVLPALIRKFHEARMQQKPFVEIWGTGEPRREFLSVDDLAAACLFLIDNYKDTEITNIGTGEDMSIRELASLIRDIVGYKGEIRFNTDKPDGAPKKLLDVTKLSAMGWKAETPLDKGIEATYQAYRDSLPATKRAAWK
ncbi:MAG: GDP-L-fucose synthase family protein [bacterium]